MPIDFILPSLGENVAGGDVLKVLVQAGELVRADQPVLELETDKATIEVPAGIAGRIVDVRVREGEAVKVGQVAFTIEVDASAAPEAVAAPPAGDAAGDDGRAEPAPASAVPPPAASRAASPGPMPFELPSLGENVAGGDVLRVLVAVGHDVARDQPVLELETDKATIEVPSSLTGRVIEVRVREGDKVEVGQVVFVVEGQAADTPAAADSNEVARVDASIESVPAAASPVRPGPEVSRAATKATPPDKPGMLEHALEEALAEAAPRAAIAQRPASSDGVQSRETPGPKRAPAAASPSVRRAARELGADIHQVPGTGPGGRISIDDVKAHVKSVMTGGGPKAPAAGGAVARVPLPDFAKFGAVERKPMRGVRRKTAEHLANAWSQIPHVTQCDLADVTALEDLRKQFGPRAESAGGKLTVTAVALKVVAAALKQFPQFNASVDMAADEIVLKKYINVGVAVDTGRGLLVPVIRDVDRKNVVELAVELQQLSERARAGKTSLDEMSGGCFTITNLGGIGGRYFTPIVNHPELAILGISRSSMQPVWKDHQFVPRMMLPLSLSYDHRVIDGADGIRFLRFVCEALEQPFLLSLFG